MAPASAGATSDSVEDNLQGPGPSRLIRAVALVAALVFVVAGGGLLATQLTSGGAEGGPVQLGAETPATAMNTRLDPANNSPVLRADPTDSRFVVLANRVDAPDYTCSLQLSGDGGLTWRPADPVPALPPGAEKCFGGEIAFDASGRLYFLFLGLAGGGNEPVGAFLTTSTDRGRTFSAPHNVLGPLNFSVRMAIDDSMGDHGRIHLVWLHATSDPPAGGFGPPPNPVLTAHSDDGGVTFSPPVQVSDPQRLRVVAPALALGGDHRVHVAYYDLRDDARDYQALAGPVWEGTWSLVVATSTDGGVTFAPGVEAEAEVTPHERVIAVYIMPPAALAARGDAVCVAWPDARNGDPDVLSRCSGDGGRRWGEALRLNDDPIGTGTWQYMPALAIAPGGRVDAIFYDRRNDRQNLSNDVRYTYSDDDGATFAPNVELNRGGRSISVVGQQYLVASAEGMWDFGARIALLSRRNDVVAAWTDTRNSSPQTTDQDIFTTTAAPPQKDRGVSPGAVVGGVALLLAGVGTLVLRRRIKAPARRATTSTVAAVALCAAVLASCSEAGSSANSSYLPAPGPILDIKMREYTMEASGPLPAGRVVFRFDNVGAEDHAPALVTLEDGVPPIVEYVTQTDRPSIVGFANVFQMKPGRTGTFAVDLEVGRRYALVCVVRLADGRQHVERGDAWETRAQVIEPLASPAKRP